MPERGLGAAPTIARNQLLRPYPQFLNVLDRQISEGVSRYNAHGDRMDADAALAGFAGRVSYTYSVLKDNQIGEVNFYTANGVGGPVNNYNYIASMPACTTTNCCGVLQPAGGLHQRDHRPAAPRDHRADLAVAVPIERGSLWRACSADWTAAALINLQSGFPIGVSQSSDGLLLGSGQRPNVVSIAAAA